MQWLICLSGDNFVLEELSKSINSDFLGIEKHTIPTSENNDGIEFRLKSKRFDSITDHQSIEKEAKEIIEWLNGASKVVLDLRKTISISSIGKVDDDGNKIALLSIEIESGFRILVKSNEDKNIADPISDWMAIASQDEQVAKALRLIGMKPLDWVGLYRIFEIIEDDVDGNKILNNDWKTSIKRFKHTANSVSAAGDDARHGKESSLPPAKPMALAEAQSLIKNIIHNWLNAKKTNN